MSFFISLTFLTALVLEGVSMEDFLHGYPTGQSAVFLTQVAFYLAGWPATRPRILSTCPAGGLAGCQRDFLVFYLVRAALFLAGQLPDWSGFLPGQSGLPPGQLLPGLVLTGRSAHLPGRPGFYQGGPAFYSFYSAFYSFYPAFQNKNCQTQKNSNPWLQ